jgi:ornithine carbamoyltransferase
MTIREYHSTLNGQTVAFLGDGNNMCNSLIAGAVKLGMKVRVATPKGYEPCPNIIAMGGNDLLLTNDPREAVSGADAVFTDVWASMGQESEAEERKAKMLPFQLNAELMSLTNPGAMVQHCLPAHKGEEITLDVFNVHADEIYDEAENRLHVQKAVMAILMG